MVKFRDTMDEELFQTELSHSGLNEDGFLKRRGTLVSSLKDRYKSTTMKQAWRKYRHSFMSGIKRFHRSTKGKQFHRRLGRFLTTRVTREKSVKHLPKSILSESVDGGLNNETLISALAVWSHLLIEERYFFGSPLDQAVYETVLDVVQEQLPPILSKIGGNDSLDDSEIDFLLTFVDPETITEDLPEYNGFLIQKIESEDCPFLESLRAAINKAVNMDESH